MKDETIANLLDVLYNVGFVGVVLGGATFAFLYSNMNNPDATGRMVLSVSLAIAVLSLMMAVGARIGMRIFYDWICKEAFAQWEANPSLGLALDPEMLIKLTQLSMRHVGHAREFLERKAKTTGIYPAQAARPNQRPYRFPRSGK